MIASYMLSLPKAQLTALNQMLERSLTSSGGHPLLPISSSRALLHVPTYKELQATLGAATLAKAFNKHKVVAIEPTDTARTVALIESRDENDTVDLDDGAHPAPVFDPVDNAHYDWHLKETNAPAAWRRMGGRDQIDWRDVVVGHLDTGFTKHPCFEWTNGTSAIIDTERDRDFFPNDFPPPADNTGPFISASPDSALDTLGGPNGGHGTKTSSVLAARDISAGAKSFPDDQTVQFAGYFGTAPRVPVVPVRISDTVWIQNVLADALPIAIDYLVNTVGCSVISLSMGSPHIFLSPQVMPSTLRKAIDNAYLRGVVVCCAAGNGFPNDDVVYPARSPRTVGVGGTTLGSLPWVNTCKGVQVDICAPANLVRRAVPLRTGKFTYAWGHGTSFATPQVAAGAAMWLAFHGPAIGSTYTQPWQRVEAFITTLKSSARVPGTSWNKRELGAGILELETLLGQPLPAAQSLQRDETPWD